jgi:hypothetical protein
MPKTLNEADKKYIKTIKLKPWKALIDSLFARYVKTIKGKDQKIKNKNVIDSLKKDKNFMIINEQQIKLTDLLILLLVNIKFCL